MVEVVIMKIIKYSFGQLQANCYFLIEGQDCLIVDPTDDASFILEELQRQQLNLVGMLATHGHFDHVMAVGEIQQSIDLPLTIHEKDKFLIDRIEQTAKHFLGYKPIILPIKNIKNLNIENSLKIENFKFQILYTPGHTPGSCCFYLPTEASTKAGFKPILFTGDTLFKDGIGRYDFSYSSKKDLKKSLERIFKLSKETVIYPGHGEKDSLTNCFQFFKKNLSLIF